MLAVGAKGLIATHGRLYSALAFAFPDIPWDPTKFSLKGKKSSQRWIASLLYSNYPDVGEILENYKHPKLEWGNNFSSASPNFLDNGLKMELDIWLPKQSVAIEYQGTTPILLK